MIAETFLAEGALVMCAARGSGDVPDLRRRHGDRVAFRAADVTDERSVTELMAGAVAEYGRLDVAVANAGVNLDGKVHRLSAGSWRTTLDTNLTGTFLTTRAAAEHMVAAGSGRVITVSSCMATRVAVGTAAYAASKAGIEMFTRVAAAELGPKGVHVNCLAPGILDAGMGAVLADNERAWASYGPRLALGRAGAAVEAARCAVFLASDSSSYVNGHVLEVNGGMTWS